LVKERPEPGLSLLEIERPRIAHPDDVLFEIAACAICTGELKVYEWGAWAAADKTIKLPTVLGHEASGVVVEVGSAVTLCKPGDRIVVDPIMGCGQCDLCRSDRANMCPNREIALVSRMGRTQATWRRMNRLLATGRFDFRPFISHVLPFDAYEQGFEQAKSPDTMKVVFKP
jgi:threonine dehydrogenase-like Zn-dependent dehydrogenase